MGSKDGETGRELVRRMYGRILTVQTLSSFFDKWRQDAEAYLFPEANDVIAAQPQQEPNKVVPPGDRREGEGC